MNNKKRVAVLGSTGYVGMELVKILSNHLYVEINFLGSETIHGSYLNNIDNTKEFNQLPLLRPNDSFNPEDSDFVFLALPCLLYTSPSPRDLWISRMPSSA